ncbi:hypothetical protein C8R44DRAFT_744763 [Mycena epipterygia]|nr:hypothetical protein C8R44DRAFT_744763 [Mycena epipterygia]
MHYKITSEPRAKTAWHDIIDQINRGTNAHGGWISVVQLVFLTQAVFERRAGPVLTDESKLRTVRVVRILQEFESANRAFALKNPHMGICGKKHMGCEWDGDMGKRSEQTRAARMERSGWERSLRAERSGRADKRRWRGSTTRRSVTRTKTGQGRRRSKWVRMGENEKRQQRGDGAGAEQREDRDGDHVRVDRGGEGERNARARDETIANRKEVMTRQEVEGWRIVLGGRRRRVEDGGAGRCGLGA